MMILSTIETRRQWQSPQWHSISNIPYTAQLNPDATKQGRLLPCLLSIPNMLLSRSLDGMLVQLYMCRQRWLLRHHFKLALAAVIISCNAPSRLQESMQQPGWH
jgi:hypothetical protein